MAVVALVAVVVAVGLALRALTSAFGPVPRHRVERFADRQELPITAENGNVVIRYLATTRRWRTTGLLLGLVTSVAASLPDSRITVNFGNLFAGWFVGAVAAEWRVAPVDAGARRAAALAPRRRTDYVSPGVRKLTNAVVGVTIALGVLAVVRPAGGDRGRLPAVLLLAATAGVLAVIVAVQRQVLRRPQPVAQPDVLDADDAIRARSLQVLAGSTIALMYFLASLLVSPLRDGYAWLGLAMATVGALLGWVVASGGSPVRRARPETETPVVDQVLR